MKYLHYVIILLVSLGLGLSQSEAANKETRLNHSVLVLDPDVEKLQEKLDVEKEVIEPREVKEKERVNLSIGVPKGVTTDKAKTTIPYIRLKLKYGDKDIEIDIDPTASDLYYDIQLKNPESITKENITGKKEGKKETTKKFADKLNEMMKAIDKSRLEADKQMDVQKSNVVLDEILKAQRYYYAKDYDRALGSVKKSLSLSKSAMGYALQGTVYAARGESNKAITSWKAALAIDPEMTEVKNILKVYQ